MKRIGYSEKEIKSVLGEVFVLNMGDISDLNRKKERYFKVVSLFDIHDECHEKLDRGYRNTNVKRAKTILDPAKSKSRDPEVIVFSSHQSWHAGVILDINGEGCQEYYKWSIRKQTPEETFSAPLVWQRAERHMPENFLRLNFYRHGFIAPMLAQRVLIHALNHSIRVHKGRDIRLGMPVKFLIKESGRPLYVTDPNMPYVRVREIAKGAYQLSKRVGKPSLIRSISLVPHEMANASAVRGGFSREILRVK